MSLFTLGARFAADARRLSTTIKIPKDDALREIRRLAAHALKLSSAQLAIREREAPGRFDLSPYGIVFDRRLRGEPLTYIMGECGFREHVFRVTPDVLIPRSETEELVDAALRIIDDGNVKRILDLGTGSGCVAISLGLERPFVAVTASDVMDTALVVARENAERLSATNVTFLQSDWYAAIDQEAFDMIVSNPPYIRESDTHLEALRFEPPVALIGGEDGLQALRTVISLAPRYLRPGGALLVEHGFDQQEAVVTLFEAAGFSMLHVLRDLSGNPRMVAGKMAEKATARPRKRRAPANV